MRVADLEGAALDYWVAKADGKEALITGSTCYWVVDKDEFLYRPSQTWYQSGPIIERERIATAYLQDRWFAWPFGRTIDYDSTCVDATLLTFQGGSYGGDRPLVAAMRCFVASKFGEEVSE